MPRLIILSGVLAVLTVGCGSGEGGASSDQAPELDGTSWSLTSIAGTSADPGAVLGFANGKLSGSTGCNSFGGSYEQSESSLSITLGPTTLIGCPPPLDAQEHAVLAALPKTSSFTVDGETLTLLDAGGTPLLEYSHLQPVSLVGSAWKVTGINNGKQAVASVIGGSEVTATFGADGSVTGSAGCNTYSAGYTLEGSALQITAPAATRMFCDTPSGVMDQEAAFLHALEASTSVEAGAQGVVLRDAAGDTQVTMIQAG